MSSLLSLSCLLMSGLSYVSVISAQTTTEYMWINDSASTSTTEDGGNNYTTTAYSYSDFTCNDGCNISYWAVDDGYCDCESCEDEDDWNCTTCEYGCPNGCGNWTYCGGYNYNVTNNSNSYFECYDGCDISIYYVNDGFCDCTECEDEDYWNCTTCADGCPSGCYNFTNCYGSTNYNYTYSPANSSTYGTFECYDGCDIASYFVNDGYCDCTECEDEYYWTCNNCTNGCPNGCGNYTRCTNYYSTMSDSDSNDTETSGSDSDTDGANNNQVFFVEFLCFVGFFVSVFWQMQ